MMHESRPHLNLITVIVYASVAGPWVSVAFHCEREEEDPQPRMRQLLPACCLHPWSNMPHSRLSCVKYLTCYIVLVHGWIPAFWTGFIVCQALSCFHDQSNDRVDQPYIMMLTKQFLLQVLPYKTFVCVDIVFNQEFKD